MSKEELVNQVTREVDLTRKTAEKAVNAVLKSIKDSLQKVGIVKLIGFGTFVVKQRQATTGRNPRTGETIKLPAKRVVRFSPGKDLKEAVANQPKADDQSKRKPSKK